MKRKKTFNELQPGDKIIIKNFRTVEPCNVYVDGHQYISEVKTRDEMFTVKNFSHYDNGMGGEICEFYLTGIGDPSFKQLMWAEDLNKTETDRFKIITEIES